MKINQHKYWKIRRQFRVPTSSPRNFAETKGLKNGLVDQLRRELSSYGRLESRRRPVRHQKFHTSSAVYKKDKCLGFLCPSQIITNT